MPAFAGERGLPGPLAPFEAIYEVSNGSMAVGTATFSLTRDSGLWRYRTAVKARGLFAMFVDTPLTETTWLQSHEGQLRPLIYRHREGKTQRRVVFDWRAGRAQVHDNGDTRRIALEPTTRDRSSAILAVMVALDAGARSVAFPGITDDGDTGVLRFETVGEESIEAPYGTYDAIRVERRHDDGRTTTTWLAPTLDWLPVRVEQREDGELTARLALTDLTRRTAD